MSEKKELSADEQKSMASDVASAMAMLVDKYRNSPNELISMIFSILANFIAIYCEEAGDELIQRAIYLLRVDHKKLKTDFFAQKLRVAEVQHDG